MKLKTLAASTGIGLAALLIVLLVVTQMNSKALLSSVVGSSVEIGAKQPPVSKELRRKAAEMNALFRAVGQKIMPTVVNIQVIERKKVTKRSPFDFFQFPDEDFKRFFEFEIPGTPQPLRGQGSGVIITEDGYILTNRHVVHNAAKIQVTLHDQRTFEAEIIGEDRFTDLAVIKIKASGLTPAYFGNSDSVEVGEWVLAVGNPLGLTSTLTAGIVSALTRQIGVFRDTSGMAVENFIQTDAAINPGNSGGGLFNLKGELIGINTAIATNTGFYQGYGFAIPSNLAKAVAADLIEDGKIDRGFIGVRISPVDQAMAKAVGLDKVQGVIIQSVTPNSAAEEVGLQEGDIILEVDGKPVYKPNEVQSIVFQHRAGDKVKLKIYRHGKVFEKTVVLRPLEGQEEAMREGYAAGKEEEVEEGKTEISSLGITVEPLNKEQRKRLKLKSGVIVVDVDPYGPAGLSRKLDVGDVIISANGKPVRSAKDLKEVLERTNKDVVLLRVYGRGVKRFVAVPVEPEKE